VQSAGRLAEKVVEDERLNSIAGKPMVFIQKGSGHCCCVPSEGALNLQGCQKQLERDQKRVGQSKKEI